MRCSYRYMYILLVAVIACGGSPSPQRDDDPAKPSEASAALTARAGDAAAHAERLADLGDRRGPHATYRPNDNARDQVTQLSTSDSSGPDRAVCKLKGSVCSIIIITQPPCCNSCVPLGVGGLGRCS